MRVLLVEDEVRLADNLAAALRDGPRFAVDGPQIGGIARQAGKTPDSAPQRSLESPSSDALIPCQQLLEFLKREWRAV
jgi:hypothetical protein